MHISSFSEEYRYQLREKVARKLEELEDPEPEDPELAEDWPRYVDLRSEYVRGHKDYKTMGASKFVGVVPLSL